MRAKITIWIETDGDFNPCPVEPGILRFKVGTPIIQKGTKKMPPQVYPLAGAPALVNSAKLTTYIPLDAFELFSADGLTDEGADLNPITFTTSDATLASVVVGSSLTPPIAAPFVVALVPGVPATGTATVKIVAVDSLGNTGELDITFSAPVAAPGVIVMDVATPVVQ